MDETEAGPRQEGGELFHQVTLTLEEALQGVERKLDILGHKLVIRIPPGVSTNTQLRIPKDARRDGKADDDIYVVVRVLPHDVYWLDGDNLRCAIRVSDLGKDTEVEIPALGSRGPERLVVPANTKPGSTFRLRGLGVKHPKRAGDPGDLYVTVEQTEGSADRPSQNGRDDISTLPMA